jgi:hypothetical protein
MPENCNNGTLGNTSVHKQPAVTLMGVLWMIVTIIATVIVYAFDSLLFALETFRFRVFRAGDRNRVSLKSY